jgi:hypothetical protein
MVMPERIVVPYPVDQQAVNMQQTPEEEAYDMQLEKNVLDGIIHPRIIRWHQEDPNNPAPVTSSQDLKRRYRNCKLCAEFDQERHVCDLKNKHMPLTAQFQNETCPLNKW